MKAEIVNPSSIRADCSPSIAARLRYGREARTNAAQASARAKSAFFLNITNPLS